MDIDSLRIPMTPVNRQHFSFRKVPLPCENITAETRMEMLKIFTAALPEGSAIIPVYASAEFYPSRHELPKCEWRFSLVVDPNGNIPQPLGAGTPCNSPRRLKKELLHVSMNGLVYREAIVGELRRQAFMVGPQSSDHRFIPVWEVRYMCACRRHS